MKIDWKTAAHFAPIILAFTPYAALSPFVAQGIAKAEQMHGATKEQKLALAVAIAKDGIDATNAQAGAVLIDPAQADTAIATGISAVVNGINLVRATQAAVGRADAPDVPETREVSGGSVVIGTDKDAPGPTPESPDAEVAHHQV